MIHGQEPLTPSLTTNWGFLNKSRNFWGSAATSTKWEWRYFICHNVRELNQRGVRVWDSPQISPIGTWYIIIRHPTWKRRTSTENAGSQFLFSRCTRNRFLCSLLTQEFSWHLGFIRVSAPSVSLLGTKAGKTVKSLLWQEADYLSLPSHQQNWKAVCPVDRACTSFKELEPSCPLDWATDLSSVIVLSLKYLFRLSLSLHLLRPASLSHTLTPSELSLALISALTNHQPWCYQYLIHISLLLSIFR